jgi:hypothetical protein
MGACLRRGGVVVVLAVAALLSWLASRAEAHPHLVGPWRVNVPPGGFMLLEFGPGEYLGNGTWRGPFTYVVSGHPTSVGVYELQMFTGTEGTLGLRENLSAPGWNVGTVDFGAPSVTLRHTIYKRP